MKDASIAPYILAHKKKLTEKAGQVVVGRTIRSKSSVFSLPEFTDWDKMSVAVLGTSNLKANEGISFSHIEEKPNRNLNQSINQYLLSNPSKVIGIVHGETGSETIHSTYHQIETSQDDLIICQGKFFAMSFELFLLAQGLDELIEKAEDAVFDLALRAELLGGTLSSSYAKDQATLLARKNVKKGHLIANQGSENFN